MGTRKERATGARRAERNTGGGQYWQHGGQFRQHGGETEASLQNALKVPVSDRHNLSFPVSPAVRKCTPGTPFACGKQCARELEGAAFGFGAKT
eukprot:345516-Prorocentrum_minimum.AAC.1